MIGVVCSVAFVLCGLSFGIDLSRVRCCCVLGVIGVGCCCMLSCVGVVTIECCFFCVIVYCGV